MKATVRRVKQPFGWAWRAETELEPGNVFSRYREFFSEWRDAIKWALRPCAFHTGIEGLRSENADLRERNAELEAQHELSGQAYLVLVNELRKTQAERDRALSELAETRKDT